VKHGYKIEILGNTFTSNSGTKGIIFIDSYDRNPNYNYVVVIGTNTFTQNAGYIDSNVIYIRARGDSGKVITTLVPSSTANLFCNGYHFQGNTFTNNFGCSQKAGGVIKMECVNNGDVSNTYNDKYAMGTLDATALDSYQTALNGALSYTAIATYNPTYNGVTYTVDVNKVVFTGN
jgi:hypothetical protein